MCVVSFTKKLKSHKTLGITMSLDTTFTNALTSVVHDPVLSGKWNYHLIFMSHTVSAMDI